MQEISMLVILLLIVYTAIAVVDPDFHSVRNLHSAVCATFTGLFLGDLPLGLTVGATPY